MPAPGDIFGSKIGPSRLCGAIAASSFTSVVMAALNAGWCARFTAKSTKDIKSVKLRWTNVSAPGTVQLRIETIDATTGKPTGTLYDANAVYDITPASGAQTYTFVTLPTAGLTIGTEYAIVLVTTVAGTTQTILSHVVDQYPSWYPVVVLTTATAPTRSSFAEVTGSVPTISLVWEDDSEDNVGFFPFHNTSIVFGLYSNRAAGLKLTLDRSEQIIGISLDYLLKTGTPAGNLRCTVLDANDNAVSGTTIILDKDSLSTGANSRGCVVLFTDAVTLAAGTYRVLFDSVSSVDASNCWGLRGATFFSSGAVGSWRVTTTIDITGTPIVWTDSTTDISPVNLLLYDYAAGGGGNSGPWGMIR